MVDGADALDDSHYPHPVIQSFPARRTHLNQMEIRRALPVREHRLVGPWCFLDRYGPLTFGEGKPMDVAPHPHIGLQTVSWLLDGEVLHRDSLGSEQMIRPGELNLMTSGAGIAHSEETPRKSSGRLSGVQLWVALPDAARNSTAAFAHHASLPRVAFGDGEATVIIGELGAARSPAAAHSSMVGADIMTRGNVTIPLRREFEHALFVLDGSATLEDQPLTPDILYYLTPGRSELALTGRARLLVLGGTPFGEPIVMWWNFVARTHEEIAAAREAWQRHEYFGEVRGYDGPRIEAPALIGHAAPNPAS